MDLEKLALASQSLEGVLADADARSPPAFCGEERRVDAALLARGARALSLGGSPRPAADGPSNDPLVDWRLPFEGSV
jgi:hypothetical protein